MQCLTLPPILLLIPLPFLCSKVDSHRCLPFSACHKPPNPGPPFLRKTLRFSPLSNVRKVCRGFPITATFYPLLFSLGGIRPDLLRNRAPIFPPAVLVRHTIRTEFHKGLLLTVRLRSTIVQPCQSDTFDFTRGDTFPPPYRALRLVFTCLFSFFCRFPNYNCDCHFFLPSPSEELTWRPGFCPPSFALYYRENCFPPFCPFR